MSDRVPFPDDVFFRELEASAEYIQRVAQALRDAGVAVTAGQIVRRDNPSQIADFTRSEVDLRLAQSGLVLEVKSRSRSWTTNETFPFGTMFVDTVSGFNAKTILPLAYVCISQVSGAMSVVSTATREMWTQEYQLDEVRGVRDLYYACPKRNLLTFDWLVKLVRRLDGEDDSQKRTTLLGKGFTTEQIEKMRVAA